MVDINKQSVRPKFDRAERQKDDMRDLKPIRHRDKQKDKYT